MHSFTQTRKQVTGSTYRSVNIAILVHADVALRFHAEDDEGSGGFRLNRLLVFMT